MPSKAPRRDKKSPGAIGRGKLGTRGKGPDGTGPQSFNAANVTVRRQVSGYPHVADWCGNIWERTRPLSRAMDHRRSCRQRYLLRSFPVRIQRERRDTWFDRRDNKPATAEVRTCTETMPAQY